jgi:predicted naringenin-chalcone synthase
MDLVDFMKQAHGADPHLGRRLDVLYRRSGIERRHSCLEDYGRAPAAFTFYPPDWKGSLPTTSRRMETYRTAALPLARTAAERALARLPGLAPGAVTHLIVTTCTGFYSPGLDVDLVNALGLSPQVARTLVGFQGCHAGVSSLRLADAICCGDPQAVVLVVCVELCTLHFQIEPSDDNLLANSLFADGAAAAVVAADRENDVRGGDGAGPGWRRGLSFGIERTGSWLAAGTEREMAWTIGDHGFQMGLSALVPRLLGVEVGGFLERALAIEPDELGAFDFWAVHPGGPAILDQVERALGLAPGLLAPSRRVLADYGNMSSPTVFFVLERIAAELAATDSGAPRCGVALAFGPGLTLEAAVLTAMPSG